MKKIFDFTKGIAIGLVIFCALGFVAHAFVSAFSSPTTADDCAEYSLSNRFECAFSFSTPESHKYYFSDDIDSNESPVGKTPYLAHPLATYAFLLFCGVLGALPKKEDKKVKK